MVTTDTSILGAVASGGAVAILAVIIFIMYRNDKKEEIARWEAMAKSCIACKSSSDEALKADMQSRENLAKVLTRLVVLVEHLPFAKTILKDADKETADV